MNTYLIMKTDVKINIMNKEQIVNDIYSSYGSDSGVLFGITERDVVKAIVEFTLNRCNPEQEATVGQQVGEWKVKFIEWLSTIVTYDEASIIADHVERYIIPLTSPATVAPPVELHKSFHNLKLMGESVSGDRLKKAEEILLGKLVPVVYNNEFEAKEGLVYSWDEILQAMEDYKNQFTLSNVDAIDDDEGWIYCPNCGRIKAEQ